MRGLYNWRPPLYKGVAGGGTHSPTMGRTSNSGGGRRGEAEKGGREKKERGDGDPFGPTDVLAKEDSVWSTFPQECGHLTGLHLASTKGNIYLAMERHERLPGDKRVKIGVHNFTNMMVKLAEHSLSIATRSSFKDSIVLNPEKRREAIFLTGGEHQGTYLTHCRYNCQGEKVSFDAPFSNGPLSAVLPGRGGSPCPRASWRPTM